MAEFSEVSLQDVLKAKEIGKVSIKNLNLMWTMPSKQFICMQPTKSRVFCLDCPKCKFRLFCIWLNPVFKFARVGIVREHAQDCKIHCTCIPLKACLTTLKSNKAEFICNVFMKPSDKVKCEMADCHLQYQSPSSNEDVCIVCQIVDDYEAISEPSNAFVAELRNDALENFKTLLDSRLHCDIKLVAGDEEFMAHKAILAARSPKFRAMLDDSSLEIDKNGISVGDGITPDVMRRLLIYIYSGEVHRMAVQTCCLLYLAANQFELEKLKQYCSTEMRSNLDDENVFTVLDAALKVGDAFLKVAALRCIRGNAVSIMKTEKGKDFLKKHPEEGNEILMSFLEINEGFRSEARNRAKSEPLRKQEDDYWETKSGFDFLQHYKETFDEEDTFS